MLASQVGSHHSAAVVSRHSRRGNRVGAVALVTEFDPSVAIIERETLVSALGHRHCAVDVDSKTERAILDDITMSH